MRRLNDGEDGWNEVDSTLRDARWGLKFRDGKRKSRKGGCKGEKRQSRRANLRLVATSTASYFVFPFTMFLTLAGKRTGPFDRNERCLRFYEDLEKL